MKKHPHASHGTADMPVQRLRRRSPGRIVVLGFGAFLALMILLIAMQRTTPTDARACAKQCGKVGLDWHLVPVLPESQRPPGKWQPMECRCGQSVGRGGVSWGFDAGGVTALQRAPRGNAV